MRQWILAVAVSIPNKPVHESSEPAKADLFIISGHESASTTTSSAVPPVWAQFDQNLADA